MRSKLIRHPNYAALAQLVEHMPEEHGVLGSIPRGGTTYGEANRLATVPVLKTVER
jgi:hypothetical protein